MIILKSECVTVIGIWLIVIFQVLLGYYCVEPWTIYKQAINQSSPSRHNPVHWYETGPWASPCNLHTVHLIYICSMMCMPYWVELQQHVTLEHGFSTYNHTIHVTCVFGATNLLPCIGVIYQLPWSIICCSPNEHLKSSSFGMFSGCFICRW